MLHIPVFHPHAGVPYVYFYLWWVALPLQAKLDCWSEGMFLQMVCFGRWVMELSLSFVPALLQLCWKHCSAHCGALSRLSPWVFWEVMCWWWWGLHCAKKFLCVRILRGLSPELAFNRYSLESENMKSVLGLIYIWNTELSDNKAFGTKILSLLEMVQESR